MKQQTPRETRFLRTDELYSAIASPSAYVARLMKQYDIHYDRHHRQILGHEALSQAIEAISKVRFEDYRSDVKSKPKGTAQHERLLVKNVEKLSSTARTNVESSATEFIWRTTTNALVFDSFDVAVSG